MEFSIAGALVAGFVGTLVMSVMMNPRMSQEPAGASVRTEGGRGPSVSPRCPRREVGAHAAGRAADGDAVYGLVFALVYSAVV